MKFKKIITGLCVSGLVIILGCSSFQDAVTPCYIPEEVIKSTGTNLPLISGMPYTSLFDARYVKTKLYYQYLLHNNLMTTSIQASEMFQQKIFSPSGPLALLLPTGLGLTLGSLLIRRPQDKKEIEELKNNAKNHS